MPKKSGVSKKKNKSNSGSRSKSKANQKKFNIDPMWAILALLLILTAVLWLDPGKKSNNVKNSQTTEETQSGIRVDGYGQNAPEGVSETLQSAGEIQQAPNNSNIIQTPGQSSGLQPAGSSSRSSINGPPAQY